MHYKFYVLVYKKDDKERKKLINYLSFVDYPSVEMYIEHEVQSDEVIHVFEAIGFYPRIDDPDERELTFIQKSLFGNYPEIRYYAELNR